MILVDLILDPVIGYKLSSGSIQERHLASESYEHSAQLATILGRGTYSIINMHALHNFCLLHERYVHPNHVLDHDHITLQSVTPNHAIFCVSSEDMDVYNTSKYPFVWAKQFFTAKKLVIMPLESFHRLAEEVGDPTVDRKLTFIR